MIFRTVEKRRHAYGQVPSIRLRNPETGLWLHLSGAGETAHEKYAWIGFVRQGAALREKVKAKGDPWPYRRVDVDKPLVASW